MRTRLEVVALTVVFLLGVGCARCGAPQGGTPETGVARHLPKSAEAAVVVPDLARLGGKVARLQRLKVASFAAQLQGIGSADAMVDSLVRQLGIDPRSRQSLEQAGVAPDLGLGVASLSGPGAPGTHLYAVIGVKDEGRFRKTVETLARNRLGTQEVQEGQHGALKKVSFSRGGQVVLSYLRSGAYAALFEGDRPLALEAYAKLVADPSLSLGESAAYQEALRRLPKERDLIVHVPASAAVAQRSFLSGGTVAAILEEHAVRLRLDLPWPHGKKSIEGLRKKGGAKLLPWLPPDAFVLAQFSGDPAQLEELASLLVGPYIRRALAKAQFDLKAEILDNLQPGVVLSLSVAESARLGAGMPSMDLRRTNPFRYVQLSALAQAKEPAKIPVTLEKVPELAKGFGAQVRPEEREGKRLYLTHYAQGEGVHFAQAKDKVVLASPERRLSAMLERLAVEGPATKPKALGDPALERSLEAGALTAVVDLQQLAESVRALPSEAWGIGGFAIKAATVKWLEAIGDLRAITVELEAKEKVLEGELSLRFVQP
jgi:hypothetical protein